MTDFKVPYTKILNITPHNNAERLEVATIYGFQVVIQKGKYQVGSEVIFAPVDSVLPSNLEKKLFPEGSKITLHKSRIRQIRIRGLASQGMIISPADIADIVNPKYLTQEQDLKEILGITKYEPEEPGPAQTIGKGKNRNKKSDHPNFHKYNGLGNIKWFPDLFQEGEQVVIQEKLHGTNARAGKLPYQANTLWKKLKTMLGLAGASENCYGSNNVEISSRLYYKGFYGEDLYGSTFKKMDVFSKIKDNETVFGEIIGPNIQKNYDYGLKESKFILFDVKVLEEDGKQRWLSPKEVQAYAQERGFEYVPVVYDGPFNKELTYQMTKGNSLYCKEQKVREGIVIKAKENYSIEGNKKALKWISEDYLDDKNNTDFH